MVDITCTRCGAEGTGFPTPYSAKFSVGKKLIKEETATVVTDHSDQQTLTETPKPKKKRTAKKK